MIYHGNYNSGVLPTCATMAANHCEYRVLRALVIKMFVGACIILGQAFDTCMLSNSCFSAGKKSETGMKERVNQQISSRLSEAIWFV